MNKFEKRELETKSKLRKFSKNKEKLETKGIEEHIGEDLSFKALGVIFKLDIGKNDDYEIDVRQLLRINTNTVLSDAEELPVKMAQLGMLVNKMKMNILKLDIRRKRKYSRIFKELRREEQNKKLSDTAISKLVEQESDYVDMNNTVAEKTFEKECVENIYWSLKEKINIITKILTK